MPPSLGSVFLGVDGSTYRRHHAPALALSIFAVSFAAYALGIFSVSGGLVWIPYYAAVLGTVAACGVGYYRGGLVVAWVVTYASLLGYHADHAYLGLSRRSVGDRLAYFVRLDGLAFLAVEGIVLGTVAFALGYLVRWGSESLRTGTLAAPDDGG